MAFWDRFRTAPQRFELGVLMVCTANICRSPLAEAALRRRLQDAGLAQRVRVASAGIHAEHGQAADPRAIAAAERRGCDLTAFRSRRIDEADFESFDWMLAMDEGNLASLQERCTEPGWGHLGMLRGLVADDQQPLAVPDPYYGPPAAFDHVLDLMEPACDALVLLLRQRLIEVGE